MIIFNNKKDMKITWNVNYELVKWINKYFKLYKEVARKNINLTFHKFNFEGEEKTQLEMIDIIIGLSEFLIKYQFECDHDILEELDRTKNRFFNALSEVYWAMWW